MRAQSRKRFGETRMRGQRPHPRREARERRGRSAAERGRHTTRHLSAQARARTLGARALRRRDGAASRRWVGQGTAGLVLLNTGLSLLGDAVRRRAVSLARPGRAR